jgi:4-hydroxy-3-methylbut-2-enyl diphosphate reductase
LGKAGELYSLGKIVHNTAEIERLAELGLKSLSYDEFRELKNATVLIRAHGEPPRTFEIAQENNITLIDATCPVVRRLQQKIRNKHSLLESEGGIVLIFGKKDHPEVKALVGQTNGHAIVARSFEDLEGLELNRSIALYSQTTMKQGEFDNFLSALRTKMQDQGADPQKLLEVHNSICGQVSSRESTLRKFATEHDIVLFVSGQESSNGKALFKTCREVNADSYFITGPRDIDTINLEGKSSIGISGATSTPGWLINEVEDYIRARMKLSKK